MKLSPSLLLIAFSIVHTVLIAAAQDPNPQLNETPGSQATDGQATGLVSWQAGFAKVDVTPQEPVRMSGYGNRDRASEGVQTAIFVRAICLQSTNGRSIDTPLVLISIDTVGVSGSMTRRLAEQIETQHAIPRSRVVFCSTHTHSAPALDGQLPNLFATELSDVETAARTRYSSQMDEAILHAVQLSINDLQPAELNYGVGSVGFAANRRVLSDGKCTGIGVEANGPVDHRVPVLQITNKAGALRGLIFNYACHCTTIGGDNYKINADWAGYAAAKLEQSFPESVALCTIGCGADANPHPRGSAELAQMHGESLADEIIRLLKTPLQSVRSAAQARYDYAALSFDLPTREELESRLGESSPQARRNAEQLIKDYQRHGRLPATYPVPIQSWRFGDDLTMIFIGGEVVVDYALRLKRSFDDDHLWVSSYSNDVMGYVASERMRAEGGYEFDRSGIYYGLPGPWATGSEDLLIDRIENLVRNQGRAEPLNPAESLGTIVVPDGFSIELVASEPLVKDPVNLAFGDDGLLWVVEMGDYPNGNEGGNIKSLADTDGDGVYDRSSIFRSGIDFPNGVQPWNDGILISAAPDILFARDNDADGRADDVNSIYTGFPLANPQHRINGFTYGLDHSLHLASGDNLGEVTITASGQTINASGHDVQIWPDSGRIAITSGRTQFVRSRDAWGRWFGNNNSLPMFHFPIDDSYFKRNPAVTYSSNTQQLFSPALAPPVYPLTSAAERFNDLFAANRFTSACSSIIALSPHFEDANSQMTAFICEPVHNLVHRATLVQHGSTFRALRHASESESEFLASTDPWFRPVRALIGPDGFLYVVDMYREVIEHPEWIPESWQQRLNVRAGDGRGRIYRIKPTAAPTTPIPRFDQMSVQELVDSLRSPIGPLRDQAQRVLIHRGASQVREALVAMVESDPNPYAKVHALSILATIGELDEKVLVRALSETHSGVLMVAIRLSEQRVGNSEPLLNALASHAMHHDPSVALHVALALGQSDSERAGVALSEIALRPDLDRWISDAIVSSVQAHASGVAAAILQPITRDAKPLTEARVELLRRILATANEQGVAVELLAVETLAIPGIAVDVRLRLAECFVQATSRSDSDSGKLADALRPLREAAKQIAIDPAQSESLRCRAVSLVGLNLGDGDQETRFLLELLTPATNHSVQCEAIDVLVNQRDIATLQSLIDLWPSFSVTLRNHLTSALLANGKTSEALLDALQDQRIRVNDLPLAAREQLLKTGSRSMRVKAERLIRGVGSKERAVIVREVLSQFTTGHPSDPALTAQEVELGRSLFVKHCGVCHSTDPNSGVAIGASLQNLTNRSDEALLESILDPNRSVEPKYQSYVVQTEEGRTLAGVIESEVADSLTIAHADGKKTTIRRDQIERIQSTGVSLMPEGFETTLRVEDIQAIVRYLQR